jgi:Asp-tRNA(Asn)/Glu-tRNA(Gln) amidotransferase A subunit family amidase
MQALGRYVKVCEPVELALGEADRCFDVIRAQNFIAGFQEAYERDPALLSANTRINYEMGLAMSLGDAVWAHAEQTRIFRRFQMLYEQYDLIISPTCSVSPFPWEQLYVAEIDGRVLENYYRWLGLTYVVTLLTNPAISLPFGVDHAGMPFGVQVVGRFRGDRGLLDMAQAIEGAVAHDPILKRARPDLSRLPNRMEALRTIVTDAPDTDLAQGR